VSKRPVRRSFSTGYKRRILEEASRCRKPGEIGALLRREGLYSSTLTGWRRQLAAGLAWGLAPKPRGPKPRWANPLAGEVERLERDNQRLKRRLEKAELIIAFQKKPASCWGLRPRGNSKTKRRADGPGPHTGATGRRRGSLRGF